MKKDQASGGQKIYALWNKLESKPLGKWLFNRIIAWNIPYTGTIKAEVKQLKPGICEVVMRPRKKNTNHLRSIHAIALSNLGELASGLAMSVGLPSSVRGIVTRIDTEYLKKARGRLLARADIEIPEVGDAAVHHTIQAKIEDEQGDQVALVSVTWLLSPVQ
ncbi:DUF4442 domain-containing protein [Marinicella sp. W31]|uniref:DUF4442 domain-containing protein n=1 Tax=Marinicella sp. W31 TaxID=3023713 RepID=UPI003757721B